MIFAKLIVIQLIEEELKKKLRRGKKINKINWVLYLELF